MFDDKETKKTDDSTKETKGAPEELTEEDLEMPAGGGKPFTVNIN